LAGGIPDLQLHRLSVELDGADFEVNTDGGDIGLGVCIIGKSQEQAGLSDTRVSDKEQLEEVIISMVASVLSSGILQASSWKVSWVRDTYSGFIVAAFRK
jgi:hypothetical protein